MDLNLWGDRDILTLTWPMYHILVVFRKSYFAYIYIWKRNSLSFPWYFHEKYFPFNEVAGKSRSGSNTLLHSQLLLSGEVCHIHKSHYNQSVNGHNLGRMAQDPQTNQTGENLSLLGHYHKFPEFSLIFCVLTKFPEFSLTGKLETPFQGFPWFPEWLGTLI